MSIRNQVRKYLYELTQSWGQHWICVLTSRLPQPTCLLEASTAWNEARERATSSFTNSESDAPPVTPRWSDHVFLAHQLVAISSNRDPYFICIPIIPTPVKRSDSHKSWWLFWNGLSQSRLERLFAARFKTFDHPNRRFYTLSLEQIEL